MEDNSLMEFVEVEEIDFWNMIAEDSLKSWQEALEMEWRDEIEANRSSL